MGNRAVRKLSRAKERHRIKTTEDRHTVLPVSGVRLKLMPDLGKCVFKGPQLDIQYGPKVVNVIWPCGCAMVNDNDYARIRDSEDRKLFVNIR